MSKEKRLIDANALKEHIEDLPTWWADGGGVYGKPMKYPEGMFDCEDIIGSIDDAPTVDVVEIETLRDKYHELVAERAKNSGDVPETYTTGYRYGHINGQIELLQQILGICDGVREQEENR